ncbi:iron chelate uptake ABC transporter family permease subunit [Campylobacter concisus]|uniref:iron chelate uptake ABC transporter family permease subunit n=1 Tax=Campylobacter concisus TaxID=199 RepID=UPI00214D386F|nr:iron chelate uptake ABC transporter family permease subunit [Campylobacter concisus]
MGWVGLIIPHIMRFVVGANFITLFPAPLLGGGLFLLIVDTASRSLMASEIPLGVITSLVGAPLFVYLLYKSKKGFA